MTGTNDVGALKAAHVGISVINNAELEGKLDKMHSQMKKEGKKRAAQSAGGGGSRSKDRMMRAMLEQQNMDPSVVKFGDASIASPFTARRTSVDSVLTVLRQGRCTLVTTIQVNICILCVGDTDSCAKIYCKSSSIFNIILFNCMSHASGVQNSGIELSSIGIPHVFLVPDGS